MRERGLITPNGEVADLVDKSFADYVNGEEEVGTPTDEQVEEN